VELSELDLRYEGYRLRDDVREAGGRKATRLEVKQAT